MKKRIIGLVLLVWQVLCISACRNAEVTFVDANAMLQEDVQAEAAEKTPTEAAEDDLHLEDTQQESTQEKQGAAVETEAGVMIVHVCGAVVSPGVYELEAGSRIADAIGAAGGLLEQAAPEYINLAAKLTDGSKVWIPNRQEAEEYFSKQEILEEAGIGRNIEEQNRSLPTAESSSTQTKAVNINTADKELLCTLSGIGPTRAERILEYRQENGPFSSIEDIMKVNGIKESSFLKIKDAITVE